MSAAWIDVSVPIRTGMVHWPGDPAVLVERTKDLARGDAANVSRLDLGAHSGTHMDAPRHFIADGAAIDEMPLDAAIGPARVIPIEHPRAVLPEELEQHRLRAGERVLFRTRNSERCWKSKTFVKDFVYISAAAAQFLARRKVRTVGIDYLSVGGYVHDGIETHRALLGAGIWLIEGLNLAAVQPGRTTWSACRCGSRGRTGRRRGPSCGRGGAGDGDSRRQKMVPMNLAITATGGLATISFDSRRGGKCLW